MNRVSEQSKRRFKQQKDDNNSKSDLDAPLTHEQKRHLEALIARGGGQFVGKNVFGNTEWFAMAKEKNVCATCAAHGHRQRDCSLTPKDKKKGRDKDISSGKGQLNAMLPGLDSEMLTDCECFASLADHSRIPLAIFSCSINGEHSCSCGDTGASRCGISRKYATRAGLKVQTTPVRIVKLPNGQVMKSYGSVEFMLRMGEWQGMVTAMVLDMDADFDVVLGMEWFLEWEPNWHYRPLSLSIATTDGVKRIARLPTDDDFTILNSLAELDVTDLRFSLMTVKDVEKDMKKGAACTLYFTRSQVDVEEDVDGSSEGAGNVNDSRREVQINSIVEARGNGEGDETPQVDDVELQWLLRDFRDIWRNEPRDGLPPQRVVDHRIDTGNENL